jgi:hypothetical protein
MLDSSDADTYNLQVFVDAGIVLGREMEGNIKY